MIANKVLISSQRRVATRERRSFRVRQHLSNQSLTVLTHHKRRPGPHDSLGPVCRQEGMPQTRTATPTPKTRLSLVSSRNPALPARSIRRTLLVSRPWLSNLAVMAWVPRKSSLACRRPITTSCAMSSGTARTFLDSVLLLMALLCLRTILRVLRTVRWLKW